MASILSLIAGLVVGVIAGWLLRGRQIARTQSTEAHVPAQSTGSAQSTKANDDTEKVPALVGAKSEEADVPTPATAVIVAEPTAAEPTAAEPTVGESVAEPAIVVAEPAVVEPVASERVESEPVESERVESEPVEFEPVAAEPVESEPVAAEPVESEPVAAKPVAAEPVAAEPVAAEPVAAELVEAELVEADVVAVQTIAEPDDLTKIAGIGPKMAMALAASGITTFEQLAETPLQDIRAAVTAGGMRLAPTAPTWAEQAKRLAGLAS